VGKSKKADGARRPRLEKKKKNKKKKTMGVMGIGRSSITRDGQREERKGCGRPKELLHSQQN